MNAENKYDSALNTIILPMDGLDLTEALSTAAQFRGRIWGVKVHHPGDKHGYEPVINMLKLAGGKVMSDPKLKDIPNTVKDRGMIHAGAGADYLTVMADGGTNMMDVLNNAIRAENLRTQLLAVTVLTSFTREQCRQIYGDYPEIVVPRLALEAAAADVFGVVSSPQELAILNGNRLTRNLSNITPGIRMSEDSLDDQQRIDGPYQAVKAGADKLVIGRPILKPKSGTREEALMRFLAEIDRAWTEIKQDESTKFKEDFKKRGALWHDSKMESPFHAKLASGRHSNFFFNATKVIQDPRLMEQIARSRSLNLAKYGHVDWVIGSAVGGISIAYELARVMGSKFAFTEKLDLLESRDRGVLMNFINAQRDKLEGSPVEPIPAEIQRIYDKLDKFSDDDKMVIKRFDEIKPGQTVLACEDVVTTGGTTGATLKALLDKGCNVITDIIVICDRSDKEDPDYKLDDYTLNSLVTFQPKTWNSPEECEMCLKGSEPVKAKEHWIDLKNS